MMLAHLSKARFAIFLTCDHMYTILARCVNAAAGSGRNCRVLSPPVAIEKRYCFFALRSSAMTRHALSLALLFLALSAAAAGDGNRLTYLDENNPYYPNRNFPKLTTP